MLTRALFRVYTTGSFGSIRCPVCDKDKKFSEAPDLNKLCEDLYLQAVMERQQKDGWKCSSESIWAKARETIAKDVGFKNNLGERRKKKYLELKKFILKRLQLQHLS